ncbi:hypothetical protein ACTFIR_003963 [Dictyostelium discoideum]
MEIESIEYSTNNTINPSTGYSLVVLNKCLSKINSKSYGLRINNNNKNEEEDEGVEDDDEEVKEGDSEENEEEEDDYDDYDEVNQEDDDYDDKDDKDNHQKLLAKLAPQIKLWFYIYLRLLILDIPTMLEYIKNDERSRRGEEKAELLLCTSKPNLPPPLSCTIITPHPHDIHQHDMAVPYREL